MSEIRNIPNIPDMNNSSGIFKFDAGKKALVVPLSAVEGLDKLWADYARETGVAILPYNRCETNIEDWEALCKRLHYVIAYFIHANDLSTSEAEEEICFAMDEFAERAGLPAHDWDTDYEELYAEKDETSQD